MLSRIPRADLTSMTPSCWCREEAQTMAEYAVVLGVITLAIVSAFGVLSGAIQGVLGGVTNLL